ncbi:PAS domain S-box protein [Candidatus Peregrinibacteria bacterium]|nr:PAS domain S-box protein [Candidatus Peregrinibacteria bacterium]
MIKNDNYSLQIKQKTMYQFWNSNKNVLGVAAGLFTLTLTGILMFLNFAEKDLSHLQANSVHGTHGESHQTEYQQFIDDARDSIIIIALDGQVEHFSHSARELTGYGQDDLSRTNVYDLVGDDGLRDFTSAVAKVVAGNETMHMVGPYEFKNEDGSSALHISTLKPINEEGEIKAVQIIFKDIQEKIRNNENEEKQKEKSEQESDPEPEEPEPESETEARPARPAQPAKPIVRAKAKTIVVSQNANQDMPAASNVDAKVTKTTDEPKYANPSGIPEPPSGPDPDAEYSGVYKKHNAKIPEDDSFGGSSGKK